MSSSKISPLAPAVQTFFIKTLGCRLNQAESATLAGGLLRLGFSLVEDLASHPDIYILHTCAITHAAEQEAIRLLRHARRTLGPDAFLVAIGCATEVPHAPDALRNAGANLVLSQTEKPRLPELLSQTLASLNLRPAPAPDVLERIPGLPHFTTTRALLKVQDGCAFRCSYCIVPSTRGLPRSRPFEEILAEAEGLFAQGYHELVLTGVNIACYRHKGRSLRALCEAILALPSRGASRLRLGSIEPATAERELLDLAASNSGLCPFFHFPLQSGSDRILQAMGRHYSVAQYAATLEAALRALPNVCLGADVITGFPGETDDDFAQTRALLERYPFGNLHVFPYSERPGTPAASLPNSVPVALRRARARELLEIAESQRAHYASRFLNHPVEVLIERVSPDGIASGWSREYLECHIPHCSPADVNTLRSTRVVVVEGDTLLCE